MYEGLENIYQEMPNDFVMVRHGQSEANITQAIESNRELTGAYEDVALRADWQQRLTKVGVEQSKLVGKWIKEEFGGIDNFDGCYVSPFLRTRETASYFGGNNWMVDDRIVERFRGVYGVVSYQKYLEQEHGLSLLKMRDVSPWYARLDGAESLQDAFNRFRAFQNSIERRHGRERVIIVSHGDFIRVARYTLEWMMPETWQKMYRNQKLALPNCAIVHYSKVDPLNPANVQRHISWRRIIYVDDVKNSPFGGRWQKLKIKRRYSAKELREGVDDFPRLLRGI